MSTLNSIPFRSTIFYRTNGTVAPIGTVFTISTNGLLNFSDSLSLNTLTASTITGNITTLSSITASTIRTAGTNIALGQSVAFPNRYLELGTDVANSVYLDFHSNDAGFTDYSTRIQSLDGTSVGSGGLNMYASTMGLMASSGVGIGKTSPQGALDVNGIVYVGTGANVGGQGMYINTGWVNSLNYNEFAPFQVAIRNTKAFVINTNGNVGIGTALPGYTLDVNSGSSILSIGARCSSSDTILDLINTSAAGSTWRVGSAGTGSGGGPGNFYIYGSATGNVGVKMVIAPNGNVGIGAVNPMYRTQIILGSNSDPGTSNVFGLTTADSSLPSQRLYMGLVDNGGSGTNSYSWISASRFGNGYNTIAFQPLGGRVGIGITNPAVPLHVGVAANVNVMGISWTAQNYNSALSGPFSSNQDISAYFLGYASSSVGFLTYSDRRIKKDIEPATNCLDIVTQLQPVTFYKKNTMEDGNELHTGFIAQDVEEVYPSAIYKRTDTIPSIYEIRHAVLIERGIQITESIDVPLEARVIVIDFRNKKIQMIHRPDNILLFENQDDTIELDGDKVFIFGHEVSDKLMLNKDTLFAVGMGAIKELAQKHDALTATCAALQARMDALEARLAS